MKILIVNKLYHPWVGGVETIVKQLADGFASHQNQIEVLVCTAKGKGGVELEGGIKIVRASSWGIFKSMPMSFSFFRLFKKMSAETDWIGLHHPFPLSFLAYFIFRPKAKLIIHYHSDIVRQKFFGFLLKPIIFWVLKRAQHIVVSNPNMINSSPILSKFSSQCRVVPFGVDIDRVDAMINADQVEKIKSQYGEFILFVGRLNYYKGVSVLLDALKDCKKNLVIIGSGAEEINLKNQVKELGIGERVFFIKNINDKELMNFYKAARVFVLPSLFKSETFGIVLLEAMACGTPVISTELGTGTSFINSNNATGQVVPAGNSTELTQALNNILNNSDKHDQYARAARQRVQDFFTLDNMIRQNLKLLE